MSRICWTTARSPTSTQRRSLMAATRGCGRGPSACAPIIASDPRQGKFGSMTVRSWPFALLLAALLPAAAEAGPVVAAAAGEVRGAEAAGVRGEIGDARCGERGVRYG